MKMAVASPENLSIHDKAPFQMMPSSHYNHNSKAILMRPLIHMRKLSDPRKILA